MVKYIIEPAVIKCLRKIEQTLGHFPMQHDTSNWTLEVSKPGLDSYCGNLASNHITPETVKKYVRTK